MKKTKNKIKILIGFILGIIVAGGSFVVYAIAANNIIYTDTYNIGATNVGDALDKLYTKAASKKSNFVAAYKYSTSSATKCITGLESTCVATDCYKDTTTGKCNAGDIIQYRVNDQKIETFHVMYDDASTITMQAQKNTVYNTAWITALDYSGSTTYGNDKGPLTILTALESATAGWSNVGDITYEAGTTKWGSMANAYTGCSAYNTCASPNKYTLASRTAKARLITVQEAKTFGCTDSSSSCPKWMNNYLKSSTSYGGTVNDTSHGPNNTYNYGYWTMSATSSHTDLAWRVDQYGSVGSNYVNYTNNGARAVVQVSK